MFSADDTIVAIATPPGRGGLGVVRLSGPLAASIAATILERQTPLRPRQASLARISDVSQAGVSRTIDEVIVTFFPGPRSYTGEDVVEITAHGSPVVLERIVRSSMRTGARLAAPGEFTFRAFLGGRLDLVQAEAVADLIEASTPRQAELAFDQLNGTLTREIVALGRRVFDVRALVEASLDFPEEGYHFVRPDEVADRLTAMARDVRALLAGAARGRIIREGRQVAVAGRANVGKSLLFNRLLGTDRAIVTEVAGTTRDLLTERLDLEGIPITLVDTAGLRDTEDFVEREGVARAHRAAAAADLTLVVLDRSAPLQAEDHRLLRSARPHDLVVVNKVDLGAAWDVSALDVAEPPVSVSALTGEGLNALGSSLARALTRDEGWREGVSISNVRHIRLVEGAVEAIERARDLAAVGAPEELVLVELQDAQRALEDVTGAEAPEALLEEIFGRFCVGK